MGGANSEFADNGLIAKHKKALCILASGHHVRLTLMSYIDFIAFMEIPHKTWNKILAKEAQKAPPEPTLFD